VKTHVYVNEAPPPASFSVLVLSIQIFITISSLLEALENRPLKNRLAAFPAKCREYSIGVYVNHLGDVNPEFPRALDSHPP